MLDSSICTIVYDMETWNMEHGVRGITIACFSKLIRYPDAFLHDDDYDLTLLVFVLLSCVS